MVSTTFLVSLVICIAIVSAGPTGGQGKKHHGKGMKCLGTDLKITSEMHNKTKTCFNHRGKKAEGEKTSTDAPRGKMTCGMLCKYQALGILDASGKIVPATLSTVVKSVYPESVVTEITNTYTNCAKEKGANAAVKETDGKKDCSSFDDMMKCITEGKNKICKAEE